MKKILALILLILCNAQAIEASNGYGMFSASMNGILEPVKPFIRYGLASVAGIYFGHKLAPNFGQGLTTNTQPVITIGNMSKIIGFLASGTFNLGGLFCLVKNSEHKTDEKKQGANNSFQTACALTCIFGGAFAATVLAKLPA